MSDTQGAFDPLGLMVMSHAVSMIAEEMGAVLERGALSPNIRERRDASSALFDARGRMVAQAAHIPVHLGAMPESVRAVMTHSPEPGDVFLLNDPYAGGSPLRRRRHEPWKHAPGRDGACAGRAHRATGSHRAERSSGR
jgi:N-methylhydantoinase B